jgi:competence protein ComEC
VLNKEIPFLRIGLPVCVGILTGRYFKPDTFILVILIFCSSAGFLISLFFNKYFINLIYGYSLTIALFLSGLLLYNIEKSTLSDLKPAMAEYLCTLEEYPEEKEKSCRMILKLDCRIDGIKKEPLKGSILINMKKSPMIRSLLPGDILKIRCKPAEIFNRGNPCEFNYRFFLENHGIKYTAFAEEKDILYQFPPEHRKFSYRALIVREKIIGMYEKRGITGDRLGLVAAITLGQKNLLDPEQKQNFIKAGIMHIMAVSGLHAVIISMFVFALLFFLKGRFNILRIIITILFLWSFAFVTGLTPSVLRAAIMFTFIQAGKIMNRNVNNVNSVLASALVLILYRPSVLFDAGFLLSYAAVLFIICFYDAVYNVFEFKNWLADKIWQSAVVTLVAQAGTLSLTITLFNRFPTYFMLTNIVIVPLSSLLIIIGCLIPLTFPLRFLSQPLAYILNLLTGITGELTAKAASLPFSSIDNIGMSTTDSFFLFLFIFLLMTSIINNQSIPLRYPLFVLLLFAISVTCRDISDRKSSELIVYNSAVGYSVGIRNGKHLNIYTDGPLVQQEVSRHSASKNLKIKLNTEDKNLTAISAGDRRIIICNYLNNSILQITNPDYIILYGNNPKIDRQLRFERPVRSVILTSGVTSGFSFPEKGTDSLHYVKKTGAFRLRF